jgi:hypothetical protein
MPQPRSLAAYWLCTFVIAFEMTAGAIWGLLRIEYVRVVFAHLGYPNILVPFSESGNFRLRLYYFYRACNALRSGRTPGGCSTILARRPLICSQATSAWGPSRRLESAAPFAFAVITIATWALRPPERRLAMAPPSPVHQSSARWIVPILVVIVLFVLSWVFLPKGPPPTS